MNPELERRLELIEFRQQLLFNNDDYSRLLFESGITRQESNEIYNLFDSLRTQIANGNNISHNSYEQSIYRIIPAHQHNYHFAESIAQTLFESGSYEEVFEHLYGHLPKFQQYFSNQRD